MVINVNKLNLEEQEKLAAVGHFWKTWRASLSAVAIVALLGLASWYGYGWYQGRQALKAATLYDQILVDAQSGDTDKLAASLKAMQDSYASTVQAQQASLLAARIFYEKGQLDPSRAALMAAAASNADKGIQSAARLQLAGLMIEQKQYDEAIKQLSAGMETSYTALAADRMGDIYALQGKRQEAIDAYTKAFKALEPEQPYRQMIAAKLGSYGIDAEATLAPATSTASAPSATASAASQ